MSRFACTLWTMYFVGSFDSLLLKLFIYIYSRKGYQGVYSIIVLEEFIE